MNSATIDLTLSRIELLDSIHRWGQCVMWMNDLENDEGLVRSAILAASFALDLQGRDLQGRL